MLLQDLFENTVTESLSSELEDIIGMKTREATAKMKKLGFEKRNPPGGSKNELVYVGSNALTNYKQKTIIFRAEDGVVKYKG
jgi:hypothetical protein